MEIVPIKYNTTKPMYLKRLIIILAIFFIWLSIPKSVFAEKIDNYSASIIINRDGKINIIERIDYDFGDIPKHGIYRSIPEIKTNTAGKKFRLDFSNISSVDSLGQKNQLNITRENGTVNMRIGDPNKTITGKMVYILNYSVSGALTYFSDHDELYWNITGNDWNIPIDKVTGVLSIQGNSSAADYQIECFTGVVGSQTKNCTIIPQNNELSFATTSPLSPHEGLTIVVGFPKNIAAVLEPKEVISFWDTLFGKISLAVLAFIGLLVAFFWYIFYPLRIIWKWYRFGRDPKTNIGVASSWYDPPKTKDLRSLTPGETGTLIDEKADKEDISATIVDLGRRGYLKIVEEKKNDFYLQKTKEFNKDQDLEPFEKKLLNGVFAGVDSLRINDADLLETVNETKELLYASIVKEGFFPQNPDKIRKFYKVIASVSLFTLNLPLALIAFFFGLNMPRKTIQGAEAANVAKSLKNFLISQEKQLEFQARNQMFFERLLPFAVAFGVEKIWADRFKDISLKQPVWYQGYGNNTFTSYYLVNSLNSSFSSFNSAATPSSSSSGFSSGFSGGFSGGGGGGGGGGSW